MILMKENIINQLTLNNYEWEKPRTNSSSKDLVHTPGLLLITNFLNS